MQTGVPKINSKLLNAAAAVVSVAAAACLGFGFTRGLSDSEAWTRMSERLVVNPTFEAEDPARVGTVADFSLLDRNKRAVSLSQFGEVDVLVVNIWSTGCPGCEREMPSLEEMDRRLASIGKAALLTIAIDEGFEDVQHLFPRGTDLRILFDPERKVTEGGFNTIKYPETFILDGKRRIRARFDGEREWHTRAMLDYVSRFLDR